MRIRMLAVLATVLMAMSGCVDVEPDSDESSTESDPEPELSEVEQGVQIIICDTGGTCVKVGESTWVCGCS